MNNQNTQNQTSNPAIKKQKHKINLPLATLSALVAILAIFCGIYFTKSGILFIHTNGDPLETVEKFYSLVLEGNYLESYELLKDYSTLGLENIPEDEYSQKIYEALIDSYSYEITSSATTEQFNAYVTINFTYLDISAISGEISSRIEPILEEKIEVLPRNQIYDENGDYLASLLTDVYDIAFEDALANCQNHYIESEYIISLEYVKDSWKILVNDDMTYCFAGGVR